MPLSAYQALAYKDTINVYRLSLARDSNNALKQPEYSSTPVHTALVCRIQTTQFRNTNTDPLGRTQDDMFFTEDILRCASGTDIKDTDVLKVTTSGHDYLNKYFKVIGFGMARPNAGQRKANFLHIRIRLLNIAPPGLT